MPSAFEKKASSLRRYPAKTKKEFSTYLKINLEDMQWPDTFALPIEKQGFPEKKIGKKVLKNLVDTIEPVTFALPI